MKFGIDVSVWQGRSFNFKNAKATRNIRFAILRIGYATSSGRAKDSSFENNYKACKAAGVPCGCYFFGHAMTLAQAKAEAEYIVALCKGHKFEYPIYYDMEGDMTRLPVSKCTSYVKYILKYVHSKGYRVGIYAYYNSFEHDLNDKELKNYTHWVACYSRKKPTLSSGNPIHMWQFGGEYNFIKNKYVNGMIVDQNYVYVDFPKAIKAAGQNGYKKTTSASKSTSSKTTTESAKVKNTAKTKTTTTKKTTSKSFKVGDKVHLVSGARYIDGTKVPNWVINCKLYVRQIRSDKKSIVISTQKTGAVTGVVNKKYLKK